jgi:ABC-2 type transport system permease protein
MAQETMHLVPAREEALTPREHRLERGALVLRIGAILNMVATVLMFGAVLAGGTGLVSGMFSIVHSVLLMNYNGTDELAIAITFLLMQANVAALLVAMVGTLAREVWTFLALLLILIGDIALLVLLGFTPGIVSIVVTLICAGILLRDVRAFRTNPVMLKELRGRMRGIRAFMVMTIYLGLMSAFTVLLYLIYAQANQLTGSTAAGQVGRLLFIGIVGIELLLIIFIAPSFTAGSITGERERKTYDLLQTTLMSSPMFVIGKLESALSYVLLLLLSAIPLQSIAFLFGGVSELEVLLAFAILAVTAVGLGTVGLFFSTSVDRTLSASVRAYTVALVITFGVPVVLVILQSLFYSLFQGSGAAASNFPPALEVILIYVRDLLISLNPIATAVVTQDMLINRGQIAFGTYTLSTTGGTIPIVSPWITFTIIYLVLSAVLVVWSIRRMRRIEA